MGHEYLEAIAFLVIILSVLILIPVTRLKAESMQINTDASALIATSIRHSLNALRQSFELNVLTHFQGVLSILLLAMPILNQYESASIVIIAAMWLMQLRYLQHFSPSREQQKAINYNLMIGFGVIIAASLVVAPSTTLNTLGVLLGLYFLNLANNDLLSNNLWSNSNKSVLTEVLSGSILYWFVLNSVKIVLPQQAMMSVYVIAGVVVIAIEFLMGSVFSRAMIQRTRSSNLRSLMLIVFVSLIMIFVVTIQRSGQ